MINLKHIMQMENIFLQLADAVNKVHQNICIDEALHLMNACQKLITQAYSSITRFEVDVTASNDNQLCIIIEHNQEIFYVTVKANLRTLYWEFYQDKHDHFLIKILNHLQQQTAWENVLTNKEFRPETSFEETQYLLVSVHFTFNAIKPLAFKQAWG